MPTCDMRKDCDKPVSWMDHSGWGYCSTHGPKRANGVPCRELTDSEIETINRGGTLRF